VPLANISTTLTVAVADPTNVPAMDDIARMTHTDVEPVVTSERTLN
jgi:hypothetical protein